MPTVPTLLELLKAGVHFGHKTSKRHPSMEPYLYGQRNGVHIFNLEKTRACLEDTLVYMRDAVASGKNVLFVGTKKQAQKIVREQATAVGMPFVCERWLGGTITNFSIIRTLVDKMIRLRKEREDGTFERYTKKEQLELSREIERLEGMVGGLETLTKIPDIVFIVDTKADDTALREALRKKIIVVAICDSNANAKGVTKIIPANDDAVKSIALIVSLVAEAVQEGQAIQGKKGEAPVQKVEVEQPESTPQTV